MIRRLALSLALLPIASLALAADAPQIVGVAAVVVNQVRISNAAMPRPRAISLLERLALADRIETGQRSQLQILLLDRSVFSVGANARLAIDRFVYDPGRNRSVGVTVVKGAFRFLSGRPARLREGTIGTPVATIGIRGTIAEGVVGPDAERLAMAEPAVRIASVQAGRGGLRGDPQMATLVILRGPGTRTEAGLTPGLITVAAASRSFTLDRPGQAIYLPGGSAPPIGPFAISRQGLLRMQDLFLPALAERRRAATRRGAGRILRWVPTIIDAHDELSEDNY